jgi:hypothetical protein
MRLAALGLIAAMSVACAAPPSPAVSASATIRTEDVSGMACGGVGLVDTRLRGDANDPAVAWLQGQNGPTSVAFPKGFTARFTPRLEILDESGVVRFRDGDVIDGGCVWGDDLLLIGWP